MTKRILVIEDDCIHEDEARAFFETQSDVIVTYASNYLEASKIMFSYDAETHQKIKGNIDGVISDIFFPLTSTYDWNQPEPIGVRVAVELSQLGVPFVLNTAGYHHGRRYEWINSFAREQRWKLVDSGHENGEESISKNWKKSYQKLESMLN